MTAATVALAPVVDAVVSTPLGGLWPDQLQEQYASVAGQVSRLQGWLSTVAGQLQASTAGALPTEDGGSRSVTGWVAETSRSSSGAAGSELRTATALRSLPTVLQSVLDGGLTQTQAAVLARLVGRIPEHDLIASQDELVQVAAGMDTGALGSWVRHLIATHCEPALDADAEPAGPGGICRSAATRTARCAEAS